MMSSSKSDLGIYHQTKSKFEPRNDFRVNCSGYIERNSKYKLIDTCIVDGNSQSMEIPHTFEYNKNEQHSNKLASSLKYNGRYVNSMKSKNKTMSTDNLAINYNESGTRASLDSSLFNSFISTDSRIFNESSKVRRPTLTNSVYDNCRKVPVALQDYILKNRKFPLKGLHKRYFVLNSGCLTYYKNESFIARNRFNSQIDLANTSITSHPEKRRIDIDTSLVIIHLHFLDDSKYNLWRKSLTEHRQFDQYQNTNTARDQDFYYEDKQETGEAAPRLSSQTLRKSPRSHSLFANSEPQIGVHNYDPTTPTTEKNTLHPNQLEADIETKTFFQLQEKQTPGICMNKLYKAFNSLKINHENLREALETLQNVEVENRDLDSPTRSEFFSPMPFVISPVHITMNDYTTQRLHRGSSCSSIQHNSVSSKNTHDDSFCKKNEILLAADNFANHAMLITESARRFIQESLCVIERIQKSPSFAEYRRLSQTDTRRKSISPAHPD